MGELIDKEYYWIRIEGNDNIICCIYDKIENQFIKNDSSIIMNDSTVNIVSIVLRPDATEYLKDGFYKAYNICSKHHEIVRIEEGNFSSTDDSDDDHEHYRDFVYVMNLNGVLYDREIKV